MCIYIYIYIYTSCSLEEEYETCFKFFIIATLYRQVKCIKSRRLSVEVVHFLLQKCLRKNIEVREGELH